MLDFSNTLLWRRLRIRIRDIIKFTVKVRDRFRFLELGSVFLDAVW